MSVRHTGCIYTALLSVQLWCWFTELLEIKDNEGILTITPEELFLYSQKVKHSPNTKAKMFMNVQIYVFVLFLIGCRLSKICFNH